MPTLAPPPAPSPSLAPAPAPPGSRTQAAIPDRGQGRFAWLRRGACGAVLVAGSWYGLRVPAVQRADVRLGDALRRASSPPVDRAVTATTDLGSLYGVAAIAGVLAATGRRRAATDVLGIGALAWVVAQKSKTRVGRARPYDSDGVRRLVRPPAGSSYPSGHAAVAAAVMSLMAERSPRPAGRRVLHALSAYVAASRVHVGVHYPSDVIGGAGLGLLLSAAWRGPVAGAGGAAAALSVRVGRAASPLLLRSASALALGTRLRRRR